MKIKAFLCGLLLLGAFALTAYAANFPSQGMMNQINSSNLKKKVNYTYYITIASGTFNPLTVGTSSQTCPIGGTFVNSSVVNVPSYPNVSAGPSGSVYIWQCQLSIGFWIDSHGALILDPTGLDTDLTNLAAALNSSSPSWQSYNKIGSAQYTAYQFPSNAYVPVGIGGSGLGCGGAGGTSRVSCTTNGMTLPATVAGNNGQWLYFVQPGQSLSCNIHRDYGRTSACSGGGCPCDGNYTLTAGQVLIGACCNGSWNAETSNFSDPNFNTCGGGC